MCACITYLSIIFDIVRNYILSAMYYVQFEYVGFEKWMCLCKVWTDFEHGMSWINLIFYSNLALIDNRGILWYC